MEYSVPVGYNVPGITQWTRHVVQGEFNKDGTEIWFRKECKNQPSALVIVDDKTLEKK